MKLDRGELLRCLRAGNAEPDAALAARIDAVGAEVLAAVRPAACWRLYPVTLPEGTSGCRVGPVDFPGVSLRRTLAGCRQAFLFCATLGAGVDALLRRFAARGAVDLLVAQAAAAALVETYCDSLAAELLAEPEAAGGTLRPRFSPGYGDLPLATQPALLAAADATRRIGLTLTDALLMVPLKSVSAVIGVAP